MSVTGFSFFGRIYILDQALGQSNGQSCIFNIGGLYLINKLAGQERCLIVVNVKCSALIRIVVHTELNF